MNRDKCIELIRTGSAKFCANDVEISFPNETPADKPRDGFITCSEDRFRLSLRATRATNIPSLTTKFVGATDFGTATGLIDGSLFFRISALHPSGAHTQINTNLIQHFNFDRLDFSTELPSGNAAKSVEVHGLLEDYKLIAPEEQTTTIKHGPFGETESWALDMATGKLSEGWSYALIEQEKNLEFRLLKTGEQNSTFEEERRLTEAFLKSVAFIHGQHAWPIWMRHRRGRKYVLDWIRPPSRPVRSPHRPFNERIWFNAKAGKIAWSFNEALLRAFNFFLAESELAKEMAGLLHQLRDATAAGTVKTVNNIVLCALLESAVNAIYENQATPTPTTVEQEFNRLRIALIETIRQKSIATGQADAATQAAGDRLIDKLSNTTYWHIREKFRAVVEKLGLKWGDDWENLYKFWNKWRHPIIHRASRKIDEHDFATFKIQSRLAGAIHLLALRSMGYSGIAVKSVFEDVFTNI
jgi:hypothetical protein